MLLKDKSKLLREIVEPNRVLKLKSQNRNVEHRGCAKV